MQIIAVMPLQEAKTLKEQLAAQGIEIELNHSKQTCTSGCTVTVEVHANGFDIPNIIKFMDDEFKSLIESGDFNLENLNQTFDPNQETATCPACSFQFSTQLSECPDCGLAFG